MEATPKDIPHICAESTSGPLVLVRLSNVLVVEIGEIIFSYPACSSVDGDSPYVNSHFRFGRPTQSAVIELHAALVNRNENAQDNKT